MTVPIVTLPGIVGTRGAVTVSLVPFREDPRIAVSFRGVRSISDSAVSEVVMTGTNHATRPLHLLDVSASVRDEVESFLEREPMFGGWVSYARPDEPPPVPEPTPVPRFMVEQGRLDREQAIGLRDRLQRWLDETA